MRPFNPRAWKNEAARRRPAPVRHRYHADIVAALPDGSQSELHGVAFACRSPEAAVRQAKEAIRDRLQVSALSFQIRVRRDRDGQTVQTVSYRPRFLLSAFLEYRFDPDAPFRHQYLGGRSSSPKGRRRAALAALAAMRPRPPEANVTVCWTRGLSYAQSVVDRRPLNTRTLRVADRRPPRPDRLL